MSCEEKVSRLPYIWDVSGHRVLGSWLPVLTDNWNAILLKTLLALTGLTFAGLVMLFKAMVKATSWRLDSAKESSMMPAHGHAQISESEGCLYTQRGQIA